MSMLHKTTSISLTFLTLWAGAQDARPSPAHPGQGRWKIYGMELPDAVLEKVYHLNAERLFHQFRGGAQERKASQ